MLNYKYDKEGAREEANTIHRIGGGGDGPSYFAWWRIWWELVDEYRHRSASPF